MKPPRSATRCNMLRPTVLDVVGAWLCLLLHWPFHTAWLTLFLEEHFSLLDERVLSTDQSPARESHATSTNADQVTLTEGAEEGSGVDAGPPPVKVNPVYPTDTLSALYLRVLERLAPALTASQRKARSASMSDLGHYSTDMASSAGITLRLCELASRDQSALRLADYLQAGSSSSANKPDGPKRRRRMTCQLQASAVVGGGVRAFAAGDLTVGDLIRVMSCSPFLNAQTRRWIRAFLSRKGFSFMRSQSKELRGKGTLIKGQMDNAEGPSAMLTTTATRPCHVRLKNGLPEKALSAMTVEDICRLIADIVDLSFNQSLRTATNEAGQQGSQRRKRELVATSPLTISPDYSEQGHQSFTEHDLQAPEGVSEVERASSLLALCHKQVRKLNISGAVLAVCNLSELRNELGLSFGDWQLFNAVIIHLRQLEELGQVRDEGGNKKSEELVAFKRPDQPATVEGAGGRITDTGEGKASLGHQRQPRQQCEDLKKAANHELQQTESDSSGELKYSYGSKIQPPTGNSISAASEKKFTRPVGSLRSFAATLDRQPYHGTTAARHLPACPHFQEGLYRRNVQLPLTVHSHFASQQTGLSSPHAVQRYACARSTGDLAGLGGLNKHTPLADLQRHACASNASAGQHLRHQAHPGHAKMVAAAAAVAEASSITETLGRWRSGLATSGAGGGGETLPLPLAEATTAPIRSAPADTRPPQPTGEVLYHPTLAGTPLGSCGQVARKGDAAAAKYLRTKSGSFEFGVAPNGEPNPEKETATESSTTRTLKSILGSPKRPVPAAAQPDPGQQLPPTAHWYALEVRRARSEPTSQLPSQSHSRDDSHPSSPDAVYTSGASEFSYSQAELEPSDIHSACSPYSSSNSSLSSAGSSSATTSLSKTSADSSARIKDYENNQYCKRPRHEVMSLANQR